MSKKERKHEILEDIELDEEEASSFESAIAQADSERSEVRVNFRWTNRAVELVKKAADLTGVGYQSYIKMKLYQAAISDIEQHLQVTSQVSIPAIKGAIKDQLREAATE